MFEHYTNFQGSTRFRWKPLGVITKNMVVGKKEEIPRIMEDLRSFLEKDLKEEI